MKTMVYHDPVNYDNEITKRVKDLAHDKLEAYKGGYNEYYKPMYTKRYLFETSKDKRYGKGHLAEIAFCMCLGVMKRYLHQNGYDDFMINVDYIKDMRNKIDISIKFIDWRTREKSTRNVQLKYGILSECNDFTIMPNVGARNISRFIEFYHINLPEIDTFDYECMMDDINDVFKIFNI